MYTITQVGGAAGGEAFLLMTETKTALIDSGFSFSAPAMVSRIRAELKGRPLDYALLTHSHYDHASGSAYLQEEWPDVVIVGSAYAKKIFEKPSARAVIREMNDNAAELYGAHGYVDQTDNLHIDLTVGEDSIIDLGSMTFRVIETPGHTKCSIAFYSEEENLLISNETLGVPVAGRVMPCYLVGYEITMESIRKAARCSAQNILIPHLGIIKGGDCAHFMKNSLYWNEQIMLQVTKGYRDGKTIEELSLEFKELFYKDDIGRLQPEKAFLLNLSYTIPMLLKECLGETV